MKRRPWQSHHLGAPSSRGAGPLPQNVLDTLLRARASGTTARALIKRLTPPVSASVFSRAMRGYSVSVPVLEACARLAAELHTEWVAAGGA